MDFLKKCREIGDELLEYTNPLIVHHYDCDGLSAAAIISSALDTNKTVSAEKINAYLIEEIKLLEKDCVIFTDIGSSQREYIETRINNVFFIDHHPAQKKGGKQANIHDYGFNGSTDACGASTAYHCFKHTGKDLGRLGITGAIGDMQHPFVNFNKVMLDECIEKGEVLIAPGLIIPGRITKTIKELFAEKKEIQKLIEENKFNLESHYYELTARERIKLDNCLKPKLDEKSFGDAYLFPNQPDREETRDAHELSEILNACGRSNHAKKGIEAAIYGGEKLMEARRILQEHDEKLKKALREAKSIDLGCFDYYDGRGKVDPMDIGIIAGKLIKEKPVIAIAGVNEIKVSARATPLLVKKGLNLGEVVRKAGRVAQGSGGGHNIAAGASFPCGGEEVFLKKVREVIEIQLQLRS